MNDHKKWEAVERYINERLVGEDAALSEALVRSETAGLPAIAVSAAQGKQLYLTALAINAKRILEVGTLGAYSTIWMARALPIDGELISLEIDPNHANVARANIAAAGIKPRVEVITGPAIQSLQTLQGPFDLTFIDADKPSNVDYFTHALRLSRPGGVIIVDNVVRGGAVTNAKGDASVQGVRRLFDMIANDSRVSATAIQTVGDKGYDGFLMAVVL